MAWQVSPETVKPGSHTHLGAPVLVIPAVGYGSFFAPVGGVLAARALTRRHGLDRALGWPVRRPGHGDCHARPPQRAAGRDWVVRPADDGVLRARRATDRHPRRGAVVGTSQVIRTRRAFERDRELLGVHGACCRAAACLVPLRARGRGPGAGPARQTDAAEATSPRGPRSAPCRPPRRPPSSAATFAAVKRRRGAARLGLRVGPPSETAASANAAMVAPLGRATARVCAGWPGP